MAERSADSLLAEALHNGTDWAALDIAPKHLRHLLAHLTNVTDIYYFSYPETRIDEKDQHSFWAAITELEQGKPLSRIIGKRDFWNLTLSLNEATLDPRPDSETLIEAALAYPPAGGKEARILDLGTGSGCLLLSLLSEWPTAVGVGIDVQAAAVDQATQNAIACGLADRARFLQADFSQTDDFLQRLAHNTLVKPGQFEYIISNPPYIKTDDIMHLDKQVRDYDPMIALDGGEGGYDAYHILSDLIPLLLAKGGYCLLEVGIGQAQQVADIFTKKGLKHFQTRSDLSGISRLVMMTKKNM